MRSRLKGERKAVEKRKKDAPQNSDDELWNDLNKPNKVCYTNAENTRIDQ